MNNRSIIKVVSNVLSVLSSDVVNRGTTFLIYAIVSRYMDARAFGQLSIALTLFYVFQMFSVMGLPTLITRETAADRSTTRRYLTDGVLLATFGGVASWFVLYLFCQVMNYKPDTTAVILAVSLGLVPFALSAVCEAVFRGWERMHYIAFANVPANILKCVAAALILVRGGGLLPLVYTLVACRVLILLIEAVLLLAFVARPVPTLNLTSAVRIARTAAPFFGIEAIIAVWSGLGVILLSVFATETEVGLFSSASQLMLPLLVFVQSVTTAVFPILCRSCGLNSDAVSDVSGRLIELLLIVSIPGAVGLFYLGEQALVLVYGNPQLGMAAGALRILVFTVVLRALSSTLGHVLFAANRERITLRIVVIDLIVGLGLGVLLIPPFGIVGAAIAGLLTRIVDCAQHYVPASRVIKNLALVPLMWRPVLASAAMLAFLFATNPTGLPLTIIIGAIVYFLALLALFLWTDGSLGRVRGRFFLQSRSS